MRHELAGGEAARRKWDCLQQGCARAAVGDHLEQHDFLGARLEQLDQLDVLRMLSQRPLVRLGQKLPLRVGEARGVWLAILRERGQRGHAAHEARALGRSVAGDAWAGGKRNRRRRAGGTQEVAARRAQQAGLCTPRQRKVRLARAVVAKGR
jgi:hypothetical protein